MTNLFYKAFALCRYGFSLKIGVHVC